MFPGEVIRLPDGVQGAKASLIRVQTSDKPGANEHSSRLSCASIYSHVRQSLCGWVSIPKLPDGEIMKAGVQTHSPVAHT